MKILFSVLHFGTLRNFESVIRHLSERGHEVLLLADEAETLGGQGLVETLSRLPLVRWGWAPNYEDQAWFRVARKVRQGLDYLRFLDGRYATFPKLRSRAADRAPRLVNAALRLPGANSHVGRQVLSSALNALDRGMPRNEAMDALLEAERPDVALFASVTNPRAPQLDHLRSAQALGIRTGVCVYSWDHLSSKTLVRVVPDRVFVWNETQKREAIDLHRIPAERVVVTGAQVYDQWFGRAPSRSRQAFARDLGVPADLEVLLYVCSALTPDPRESHFVRQWVEAVRASRHDRLRAAAIVIRPHPERADEWRDIDWADLGPIVIAGRNPVTDQAKSDYFDTLFYSTAVVGLVTSAFLEAAIVGRPVLTVTPPEFHEHQGGMLHFRYLLEVEQGLLTVARTLPEHVTQLQAIVGGDTSYEARQKEFLTAFVRPRGLDVAATPVFAEAVEGMAALPEAVPGATAKPTAWHRLLAGWVVRSSERGMLEPWMRDARETGERRTRDAALRENRREQKLKWRRHRRRKLVTRMQWQLKRVRDLVR